MKTKTLDDIMLLRNKMLEKTEEVKNLKESIERIRSRYKIMDIHELNECVRDVVIKQKKIDENEAWIKVAKAEINAFFAPACLYTEEKAM